MLSVLAGTFIGLGALYFLLVRSDPTLGFAAKRALSGVAFSPGLILVMPQRRAPLRVVTLGGCSATSFR